MSSITTNYYDDFLQSCRDIVRIQSNDFPDIYNFFEIVNGKLVVKEFTIGQYDRSKYLSVLLNLYVNENFNDEITTIINDILIRMNDNMFNISNDTQKQLNKLIFLFKIIQLRKIFEITQDQTSRAEMIEIMKTYVEYGVPVGVPNSMLDFKEDKYPADVNWLVELEEEYNRLMKENETIEMYLPRYYNNFFMIFLIIFCIIVVTSLFTTIYMKTSFTENKTLINRYLMGSICLFIIIFVGNIYARSFYIENFAADVTQENQFFSLFDGMIERTISNIENSEVFHLRYFKNVLKKEIDRQLMFISAQKLNSIKQYTEFTELNIWSMIYASIITLVSLFVILYYSYNMLKTNTGITFDWSFISIISLVVFMGWTYKVWYDYTKIRRLHYFRKDFPTYYYSEKMI